MNEFRPIIGYEGLYEISRDGRLFAVERKVLQTDSVGRKFFKTIKRHEKSVTANGRGYRAFNLHKDNKQTCRLVSVLVRETWGETPNSVTIAALREADELLKAPRAR